jgi:hypothetical protein
MSPPHATDNLSQRHRRIPSVATDSAMLSDLNANSMEGATQRCTINERQGIERTTSQRVVREGPSPELRASSTTKEKNQGPERRLLAPPPSQRTRCKCMNLPINCQLGWLRPVGRTPKYRQPMTIAAENCFKELIILNITGHYSAPSHFHTPVIPSRTKLLLQYGRSNRPTSR